WFRLRCEVLCSDPRPVTRVAKLSTQDMVEMVRAAAAEIPATFGCATDDGGADGETALEAALNIAWDDAIPRSREVLRGYPWVTICAPEIAERLGGVQALRASGASTTCRCCRPAASGSRRRSALRTTGTTRCGGSSTRSPRSCLPVNRNRTSASTWAGWSTRTRAPSPEQGAGVRVLRCGEDVGGAGAFHDPAVLEDGDGLGGVA